MRGLVPINDCVVVELSEAYSNVASPDKQYSTMTSGTVRGLSDTQDIYQQKLLNNKVWFEEFKDGCQLEIEGVKYAFIKVEDIRGYFDETI